MRNENVPSFDALGKCHRCVRLEGHYFDVLLSDKDILCGLKTGKEKPKHLFFREGGEHIGYIVF